MRELEIKFGWSSQLRNSMFNILLSDWLFLSINKRKIRSQKSFEIDSRLLNELNVNIVLL